MAKNDFKAFATGPAANVTPQAEWETLPALGAGFTSGKASSAQVSKALRQPSTIAATIGQFIANAGLDALDDGDINGLVQKFANAITVNLGLQESFSGVVGQSRNARMSVITASSSATFTADELIVESSTGKQYRLSAFDKTINIATSGVGGMDTGSVPAAGFIAIYAILNPTNGATALLAVNATATPAPEIYGGTNMPAGYTASSLISVWRVASGQFTVGYQLGRNIYIPVQTAYSTTVPSTELYPVSFSQLVPLNAISVSGSGQSNGMLAPVNCIWVVAGNKAGIGQISTGTSNTGNLITYKDVPLITPQTAYIYAYAANGEFASAFFSVNGYIF